MGLRIYGWVRSGTVRGKPFAPQTVYLMIGRVDPTANPEGGYRRKALAA